MTFIFLYALHYFIMIKKKKHLSYNGLKVNLTPNMIKREQGLWTMTILNVKQNVHTYLQYFEISISAPYLQYLAILNFVTRWFYG